MVLVFVKLRRDLANTEIYRSVVGDGTLDCELHLHRIEGPRAVPGGLPELRIG